MTLPEGESVDTGQKGGARSLKMDQWPLKIKTKPCVSAAGKEKEVSLVSSEWNWISDRLEQPVQSRENLIPPVLFTRLTLIRCEETAGREQRVSRMPGEETSCSFCHL